MSHPRALEERLRAWCAFRDVAHATRTLAAAQFIRWQAGSSQADRHLGRMRRLQVLAGRPPAQPPGRVAIIAFGTDLGLCGPLNQRVARAVRGVVAEHAGAFLVVSGRRLADTLADLSPNVAESAPSSARAAADLAGRTLEILEAARPRPPCCLVGPVADARGGEAEIRIHWETEPDAHQGPAPPAHVMLSGAAALHTETERLLLHARLVRGWCEAARAEAGARLSRMTRAHDAADRRIAEQEQVLRRVKQERVTQEMLEVRSGGRTRRT